MMLTSMLSKTKSRSTPRARRAQRHGNAISRRRPLNLTSKNWRHYCRDEKNEADRGQQRAKAGRSLPLTLRQRHGPDRELGVDLLWNAV